MKYSISQGSNITDLDYEKQVHKKTNLLNYLGSGLHTQ